MALNKNYLSLLDKLKSHQKQRVEMQLNQVYQAQRSAESELKLVDSDIVNNYEAKQNYIKEFYANLVNKTASSKVFNSLEVEKAKFEATINELEGKKSQLITELEEIEVKVRQLHQQLKALSVKQEKYKYLVNYI